MHPRHPTSDRPTAKSGPSSSRRFSSHSHDKLWIFVVKRAFIEERVLHSKDFGPNGIIEHLEEVNLLSSFRTLGPFMKHIVLDFYVNLRKWMGEQTSPEFQKVHVRGHCLDFYPSIINEFLQCLNPVGVGTRPRASSIRLNFKLFQGKNMSDIPVGKRPSGPILPSDPVLASPIVSANVPPSFASLPSVARFVLLSWLHDEQRLLASHGYRLASLQASTNSCLGVVTARIADLQGAWSGAPQDGTRHRSLTPLVRLANLY